ncbi:hypothetical protein LTR37_021308 [Vermiconidia calcicola]|uniref:Uncharacterized protein n=1 Tax=Vermiconidia calcicola TaxID=1690605 RepID=A0ACC3MA22_9PEZI|nr:hypothetical protein LTR37_021308 [Vermiconidia calcicola]
MSRRARSSSEKFHHLDAEEKKAITHHVENVVTPYGISPEDAEFLANFPEERRKKIDWRLIPFLAFLYLVAYIDRANIGNAKIEGMTEDLNMQDTDYNIAVSIFFIPYILCELPSNAILVRFKKPSHYIGTLTVAWGIVMTCTGVVQGYGGLVATRFMLGVAEAGFFPGAVFLVSRWYLPGECQFRISLFYTSSAMAGAFSGLLAFAIAKMDGIGGVAGWRWIFILEGIASVLTGVACFFLLIDSPLLSGKWLEPDDIRYLELRQLAHNGDTLAIRDKEHTRKWQILRSVLTDWKIYTMSIVFIGNSAPNYGLKFSMPSIIEGMGFTSSTAQLLTIPPYCVGAISSVTSGFLSDRMKWRMPFIVFPLSFVVIAYAVLFAKAADIENNIPTCYFALCLACAGLYPITPGTSTWNANNLAGPTKRAQGVAFMIAMGNVGGIIGSYMFLDSEAPKYPTGWGLSLGLAVLAIVSALSMEFTFKRINANRNKVSVDEVHARYSEDDLQEFGDRSPLFRYTL